MSSDRFDIQKEYWNTAYFMNWNLVCRRHNLSHYLSSEKCCKNKNNFLILEMYKTVVCALISPRIV